MGGGRDLFALRKDGLEIPVEIGLNPIDAPDGRYALAAIVDLSQRQAADALRSRLAAIVEGSHDAIVGMTLDGVVTSWNPAAERLFGYSAEQMVGGDVSMLVPERFAEAERGMLEQVQRGERIEHYETVRRRSNGGEVDVSVSFSPLSDVRGRVVGASAISRDISEAKRREAELRRSNASLEQFAHVASHDLQEPLRMVANFTDLLAQRYKGRLDERADKYLAFASEGAHRMQRLVSDLLAYSRVDSHGQNLVPTSTEAVVDMVVRSLNQTIRAVGASVERGGLPEVLADEVQLGQLFQNLIANAIKFRSDAPPVIRISARPEGAFWTFEVSDNGIGIDPRFEDRVFQMFQRLHERGRFEGSGIGLTIARQIVERHGGSIRVGPNPAGGSTFFFKLKAARTDE